MAADRGGRARLSFGSAADGFSPAGACIVLSLAGPEGEAPGRTGDHGRSAPGPVSAPAGPLPGPTTGEERIATLDVLRGVSVLGILLINIQWFGWIQNRYMNPHMAGGLSAVEYPLWLVIHVLADLSFLTLFSMLFGAGVWLMVRRSEQTGRPAFRLHLRRMAILLVIGLIHAHALWYGDILYFYAVCGLAVYAVRRWPASWLLIGGIALIAIQSGLSVLVGWSVRFWPHELVEGIRQGWMPGEEAIAREVVAYRGSWWEQLHHRVPAALYYQTAGLIGLHGWRILGSMMLGMAALKWGVLTGQRSPGWTWALLAVGWPVGILLNLYGVHARDRAGWEAAYSLLIGSQYLTWGSLFVAAGWIGLVLVVCRHALLASWTRRLAAVGRLSLTNYLAQTLICTTLFYGHGLGLFERLNLPAMMLVVAAVWALQLLWSPLWLQYFAYGPAEWLWRSLSYLRLLPMRRPGRSLVEAQSTGPAP